MAAVGRRGCISAHQGKAAKTKGDKDEIEHDAPPQVLSGRLPWRCIRSPIEKSGTGHKEEIKIRLCEQSGASLQ